jgi:hypothetical protein
VAGATGKPNMKLAFAYCGQNSSSRICVGV